MPYTHCGKTWPDNSNFCGSCGAPLAATSPAISGTRWCRTSGEFAQRIDTPDVKAWLSKNIDVEEGTRGLLFQHGKYVGDLQAGRHTLETVTQRMKNLVVGSPLSAVLVDASQQRLRVTCPQIHSRDDQLVGAEVTLVLELADPLAFFVNMLKGARHLTITEVEQWFQPAISAVTQSLLRQSTLAEMQYPEELAEALHDALSERMEAQFKAVGFRYVRLDLLTIQSPTQGELARARGALNFDEAKAELDARRRRLNQQLEDDINKGKMAEIDSAAALREFIERTKFREKEVDLQRQQTWEKLFHDFTLLKNDLEAQRDLIFRTRALENELAVAEVKYKYDLHTLRWRNDLEQVQLQHELDLARKRFTDEQDRFLKEVETQTRIADLRRDTDNKDAAARLDRQKAKAEFALELTEKLNQQELSQKTAESQLRQAEQDADHRRKLETTRALDGVSKETLLAVTEGPQAAHLADFMKLGLYQDLTPDQILAIQSASSPAAAQALAEKARAEAQARQAELQTSNQAYERMLQMQAAAAKELKEVNQQSLGEFRKLTETALNTQRDTAVAAAGPRTPAPIINMPGTPPAYGTVHGLQICTRCGHPLDIQDNVCSNCGQPRHAR